MGIIRFVTSGFSKAGDAIGRRFQEAEQRITAKQRAEFERELNNQLGLVTKRDKAQEIFTTEGGLSTLKVSPTSLKGTLYIEGEIPITDYKKYRDLLNKVLETTNCKLSRSVCAETLGIGKVHIGQFLKVVDT